MKADEMSLLHSALTKTGRQDKKPSSLPQTTKELQTLLESGLVEGETEGEVITIYISPLEMNSAGPSVVEIDESTRSATTSEAETIVEDSPKPLPIPQRRRILNERYVGDFANVFTGNLRIKWNLAKAKVDLQKKKIKALQQRNRRLKNRIVQLRSTLIHLQGTETIVSTD